MNFKLLITFLTIFIQVSVFGFNKHLDYANYHVRIYDAERMINEQDLDSALLIYQEVFDKYTNHFHKDINNAFYCCIGLKKYELAKDYAKELVLHGYELKDFEKEELSVFKRTKSWKKFTRDYFKLRKQYQVSVDKDLRKIYDDIYIKDQNAAKSDDTKLMHRIYYKQACQLSKIFVENGFKTIGINKDLQDYHIYAALRHYCYLKNQLNRWPELYVDSVYKKMNIDSLALLKQFKTAIHEGRILPEYYASAIVYGDDSQKDAYGQILVMVNFTNKSKTFYSMASPENLKNINERRLAIGLFPIKKTSNSLLENTWYKQYPFDIIIEKLKESKETKLSGNLMMMMAKEELKVRNKYKEQGPQTNFILSNLSNLKGVCYDGYKTYLKE